MRFFREQRPQPFKHPFCPRNFVRYDQTVEKMLSTYWVCKLCVDCMIAEKDVKEHLKKCPEKPFQWFGLSKCFKKPEN